LRRVFLNLHVCIFFCAATVYVKGSGVCEMSFEIAVRSEYEFLATDSKIARLLTLNVAPFSSPHTVNVVAIAGTQLPKQVLRLLRQVPCIDIKKWRRLRTMRIVVGTDAPNDPRRGGAGPPDAPDPQRTNALQNAQFRKNMRRLGISYSVRRVIQIFNVENATGTPGIYRIFYSALVCARISVRAFYNGEYALGPDPTVTCLCTDGVTQFESEVVSAFIAVPPSQLDRAVAVLSALVITTPFNESQLCINVNNVLPVSPSTVVTHPTNVLPNTIPSRTSVSPSLLSVSTPALIAHSRTPTVTSNKRIDLRPNPKSVSSNSKHAAAAAAAVSRVPCKCGGKSPARSRSVTSPAQTTTRKPKTV
jgi:hypothetical protein